MHAPPPPPHRWTFTTAWSMSHGDVRRSVSSAGARAVLLYPSLMHRYYHVTHYAISTLKTCSRTCAEEVGECAGEVCVCAGEDIHAHTRGCCFVVLYPNFVFTFIVKGRQILLPCFVFMCFLKTVAQALLCFCIVLALLF